MAATMRSTSEGNIFASSSARNDASIAKSEAATPFSTIRLSFIPVRLVIHSSVVSSILVRSSLVSTFLGKKDPTPVIDTVYPFSINYPKYELGKLALYVAVTRDELALSSSESICLFTSYSPNCIASLIAF